MKNKFYITTTLPYVNADPHIGYAWEVIRADAWARFQRLLNHEVFFNVGTDEHGAKIHERARELGLNTQTYCDQQVEKFKELKNVLNLSFDNFIRTTDEHHVRAAQEFWRQVSANGYIYKKNYKTKYCVGCEMMAVAPCIPIEKLKSGKRKIIFSNFPLFNKNCLNCMKKIRNL
jgi:methionyl-tRNA synthetase